MALPLRLMLAIALGACPAMLPAQGPDGPPPGEPRFGGPGFGGPLFISPMGEPFRGSEGGAPAERWFAGTDRDGDGRLTLSEFTGDAARFFATLDIDHDGTISADEIDRYETVVAPEIRVDGDRGGGGRPGGGGGGRRGGGGPRGGGGRGGGGMGGGGMGGGMGGGGMGGGGMGSDMDGGGGMGGSPPGGGGGRPGGEPPRGAGRFSYLAMPEPVAGADADLNRAISRREFAEAAARRFALLDSNQDGAITRAELPKLASGPHGRPHGRNGPPPGD